MQIKRVNGGAFQLLVIPKLMNRLENRTEVNIPNDFETEDGGYITEFHWCQGKVIEILQKKLSESKSA